MKKVHSTSGVTLPELLVALVIVGFLASLAFTNFGGQSERQKLKDAQQQVYQTLKSARQIAISKTRNMVVHVFAYNYAADATLRNRIRFCDQTGANQACTGADYTSATIKQEIALPQNGNGTPIVEIRRVTGGAADNATFTFDSNGNVNTLGTIYLRRVSETNATLIDTGALDSTQEAAIANESSTGASYTAIVVSTALGKVRVIK
jgi:prepilin-type N-terminal cleavage/methylation domain-containing protein